MAMVTIPIEEINRLWFGGIDFNEGLPFPTEAINRWFRQTPEFDNKCK
jgi:hypothetical protein